MTAWKRKSVVYEPSDGGRDGIGAEIGVAPLEKKSARGRKKARAPG